MRTTGDRISRSRTVILYLNGRNEVLGWQLEFRDGDVIEKVLWGACTVPMRVGRVLQTLDTLHRSTARSQYSWTDWGGGRTPISPTNRFKVYLPGWNRSNATFSDDGSVQFPLGVTFGDTL